MNDRSVSRADAKLIAEAASDCADKALEWKNRALMAEAFVSRFVAWLDRADAPGDDCAYLNGCHPDQRAADRDGWDDIRDLAAQARVLPMDEDGILADAFLVEWVRDGETWVHAHADEPTAVDQARRTGGTCTPIYRLPLRLNGSEAAS